MKTLRSNCAIFHWPRLKFVGEVRSLFCKTIYFIASTRGVCQSILHGFSPARLIGCCAIRSIGEILKRIPVHFVLSRQVLEEKAHGTAGDTFAVQQ
jgi:hypothetical protein